MKIKKILYTTLAFFLLVNPLVVIAQGDNFPLEELADTFIENNANGIPDRGLYEAALDEGDENLDRKLSVEEAKKISYLRAQNRNVKDLTGIKYLENVNTLMINRNSISSIDELSDLHKLVRISAINNSITNINVIKDKTTLRDVDFRHNQITTLPDMTNMGYLTNLDLQYNYLSEAEIKAKVPAKFSQDAEWLKEQVSTQRDPNGNNGGGTNPPVENLNKVQSFVARFYIEILKRPHDSDGLNYWTNQLKTNQQTGADIANDIIFGEEFEMQKNSNDEFVNRLYKAFFGRNSDAAGKAYWLDLLNKGATRRSVAAEFINSKEFSMICNDYGITAGALELNNPADKNMNLTAYVYRCYTETLGRIPDDEGLNYWTGLILKGEASPKDVAGDVLFSTEFSLQGHSNESYVKVLYRTFMGREADGEGLNYWLNELNIGRSRADIFEEFAGSKEFSMILASFGL